MSALTSPLTLDEAVVALQANVVRVQLTLVDRFTPVLREVNWKLGRLFLDWYLTWPWYRRLGHDLRTGRFTRNCADAIRALLP